MLLPIKRIYEGHGHMKSYSETAEKDDLEVLTRIIHLGLMIFGLLAWLVIGWAGEHEHGKHLGFTVHSWLGMGLLPHLLPCD